MRNNGEGGREGALINYGAREEKSWQEVLITDNCFSELFRFLSFVGKKYTLFRGDATRIRFMVLD